MTYKAIIQDLHFATHYLSGLPHDAFCSYWADLVFNDDEYAFPVFEKGYVLEDVLAHTKFAGKNEFYEINFRGIYSFPGGR